MTQTTRTSYSFLIIIEIVRCQKFAEDQSRNINRFILRPFTNGYTSAIITNLNFTFFSTRKTNNLSSPNNIFSFSFTDWYRLRSKSLFCLVVCYLQHWLFKNTRETSIENKITAIIYREFHRRFCRDLERRWFLSWWFLDLRDSNHRRPTFPINQLKLIEEKQSKYFTSRHGRFEPMYVSGRLRMWSSCSRSWYVSSPLLGASLSDLFIVKSNGDSENNSRESYTKMIWNKLSNMSHRQCSVRFLSLSFRYKRIFVFKWTANENKAFSFFSMIFIHCCHSLIFLTDGVGSISVC